MSATPPADPAVLAFLNALGDAVGELILREIREAQQPREAEPERPAA
jgi:hypothetical protein